MEEKNNVENGVRPQIAVPTTADFKEQWDDFCAELSCFKTTALHAAIRGLMIAPEELQNMLLRERTEAAKKWYRERERAFGVVEADDHLDGASPSPSSRRGRQKKAGGKRK